MQIVSFGGLLATASVLLTSILGVSRMAYSIARTKDMPQALTRLHPKFCTPYYALLIVGAVMAVLVMFVDLTVVVALSTFAILFNYVLTNTAALKLKIENRRYSKAIPAVGLGTCLVLLAFILFAATQSWIIGIICLAIGALYYFAKQRLQSGIRKSR